MRTRYQRGHVYRKGNLWLVRYYDNRVMPGGTIQRVQRAHKIVEYGGQYRSRAHCSRNGGHFRKVPRLSSWCELTSADPLACRVRQIASKPRTFSVIIVGRSLKDRCHMLQD